MKRIFRMVLCFAAVALVFSAKITASASEADRQEELLRSGAQASGVDELDEALGEEARAALEGLGVESAANLSGFSAQKLFSALLKLFLQPGREALEAGAKLLLILILCAVASAFLPKESPLQGGADFCACAAGGTVLFLPLSGCIAEASAVLRGAGVFIGAAAPVYTALLISGGKSLSAGSYQYLTLLSGNLVTALSNFVVTPLLRIFLALSGAGALAQASPLSAFSEGFAKAMKTLLAIWMTVFSALLGFLNLALGQGEAVLAKAAKYASSAFVPVVGSAIGDAAGAVGASVSALRGGAGAFGMLAIAVIFTPMLVKSVLWILLCSVSASLGESLSLARFSALLRAGKRAAELICALLLSSMVVLIVSCGVVAAARSGT